MKELGLCATKDARRHNVTLQGSEIEGTFWRDVADQWYDRITEGKVSALAMC